MPELFIELRVQEIPAGMQEKGEKAFADSLEKIFAEHGLKTLSVASTSLSSRMVFWVKNVPEYTEEKHIEKRGPRVGAPQPAIDGFKKSVFGSVAGNLEQRDDGYYYGCIDIPAKPVKDILAAKLPTLIKNIPWPKSMRWGCGEMTFVRPLSGVVALFGDDVMSFDVDGLASGNQTCGHFYISPNSFTVTDYAQYMSEMETRGVMVNRSAREEAIRSQLKIAASEKGLSVIQNDALIKEVAGLVEWPHAIISSVSAHFLELPKEVLIKTMVADQRYFALEDSKGNLSHFFIGISNMADSHGNIAKGYAKVLTARFDDARFYWETDQFTDSDKTQRKKLSDRYDELAGIVFHKELGSVRDKCERVQHMLSPSGVLTPALGTKVSRLAQRAAYLSKCDLVTGVVYEFPDLQGIIGSYLAEADGEEVEVVDALYHQYKYDEFEQISDTGAALILADRLDTLVGFFGINQKPTGSKDPYALRRAALSVIRVLEAKNWKIDLKEIGLAEDVVTFIKSRIDVQLKERHIAYDIVNAVLASGSDDVLDIIARAEALNAFMQSDAGQDLHQAFKRAHNILGDTAVSDVKADAFVEPAEKDLFAAYQKLLEDVSHNMQRAAYNDAMQTLASLRTPLNAFYDDVQVMADNEHLKKNRLALLAAVSNSFQQVADFTKLAR